MWHVGRYVCAGREAQQGASVRLGIRPAEYLRSVVWTS